ncbi:N-terminal C2 in EEIG1 and EHBP1 proteins-domain-containing protein [Aspergillus taichungensis]|uniref:N-terminal C2 in EEIG1 and EHBP1 proteins-domain-containing protein n=1 Tax=Aspergillus taichungensis TaxID=482145 RepID=A0A2J5I0C9_9EURO|nr:N-terminal C2 in EEIG1 and EHBP1 proteins-domain-containing protein [Aspergillus taichungensis]
MQAFVPKNRRPRFEFILRIIDLNNVPLVSGTAFVKWRLPSSNAAEHHGHTDKAVILDHRASWHYERALQVRLTIDRNQSLHDCEVHFDVIQEFATGGHNDKDLLGRIRLNLAEYVDKSDDDEGIVRRYLMQDSKINSTLRIGIVMRQVEGDRNFTTPPLRSAMVFGGITGVVSSEQGDPDDLGRQPSIYTQTREAADLQDMYRRTLAASWNSRSDDMPADKLIEELFSGGVSWSSDTRDSPVGKQANDDLRLSDETRAKRTSSGNRLSPSFERRPRSASSMHALRNDAKSLQEISLGMDRTSGKGESIERKLYDSGKGKAWKSRRNEHEVSEFDVREDLRSWAVGGKEE